MEDGKAREAREGICASVPHHSSTHTGPSIPTTKRPLHTLANAAIESTTWPVSL